MSASTRRLHACCLALAGSLLLTGLKATAAEPGDGIVIPIPLPQTHYASLPDPSTAARRGPRRFDAPALTGAITVRENAPTHCLPGELRTVLADVAARFGPISIESTHRSRSRNARARGARGSLHLACRAVDFRLHARSSGVMAYLAARPEVGGLKRYRNGIIHIDNGSRRSW